MIEETITIHDRYQFEVKLNYPLDSDARSQKYEVDSYLFVPDNMGVNEMSYSKEQFFSDIQAYIRLKTPSMMFSRVAAGDDSPIGMLEKLLQQDDPEQEVFTRAVRVTMCIVKSAARDLVLFVESSDNLADRHRLVSSFVDDFEAVTVGYRALRPLVQTPHIGEELLRHYTYGDEYLSLLAEDHLSAALSAVPRDGEGLELELRQRVLRAVTAELAYRKERAYPSMPDPASDNETLIYRRGVLKKFMRSINYLRTRTRQEGPVLRQVVFGVSAGVAMIFATAAAFYSQSRYGVLTAPFFVVLVVSYVFKDRIKDLARHVIFRRLGRWLYDQKTRIYSSEGRVVGSYRESFSFLRHSKVPQDVLAVRNHSHITEVENEFAGERTILYRKRVRLRSGQIASLLPEYRIVALNDIVRINVRQFLRRLDSPTKSLFIIDSEDLHRIKGKQVYHLNLVICTKLNGQSVSKRFRIVINRSGIKRIEPVGG